MITAVGRERIRAGASHASLRASDLRGDLRSNFHNDQLIVNGNNTFHRAHGFFDLPFQINRFHRTYYRHLSAFDNRAHVQLRKRRVGGKDFFDLCLNCGVVRNGWLRAFRSNFR